MNSYSRETLRGGWHPTATGPYGAPRGNPVMKSKRVTGQSAQAKLCIQHGIDLLKEQEARAAMPAYVTDRKTATKWFDDDPLGRASMFGH